MGGVGDVGIRREILTPQNLPRELTPVHRLVRGSPPSGEKNNYNRTLRPKFVERVGSESTSTENDDREGGGVTWKQSLVPVLSKDEIWVTEGLK